MFIPVRILTGDDGDIETYQQTTSHCLLESEAEDVLRQRAKPDKLYGILAEDGEVIAFWYNGVRFEPPIQRGFEE
jgi:hypothetical protein